MRERVLQVFHRVFRSCDDLDSLSYGDQHWDSLKHIELITDLEIEFNVEIELAEVYSITDVDDAYDLIRKKVSSS